MGVRTARSKEQVSTKPKKVYVPLTDDEIKHLIDLGLTQRIIANYIKKQTNYKDIIPKVKGKVEELEAREWLKEKMKEFWPDNTPEHKKNREAFKVPKAKLPDMPKGWTLSNPDQELEIKLGMMPSVNHMYQTSMATGARQMTMATKKLFVETREFIEASAKNLSWEPTYKTKVIAQMWFYFPDKGVHDNHNMMKFIFDTMDGILVDDDHWILPQVIDIEVDKDNPRIEIKLSIHK